MAEFDDKINALEQLRDELILGGRNDELQALDLLLSQARGAQSSSDSGGGVGGADLNPGAGSQQSATGGDGSGAARGRKAKTYLKLKKKYYTPAEVARRVGVSRQTIVKWIERGELEAELTPGGHHRIPASVFHREGRGETVQLIPLDEDS